jgi:hypothetical protein
MLATPRARAVWVAAHHAVAQAVALWLRTATGATVYLRGSLARRDAVPGLSDVDMVAVARGGGDRSELALSLLALRRRRLGFLARHIAIAVYDQSELHDAVCASVLTYGLDGRGADEPRLRALSLASRAPADELGLRVRRPLPDARGDWVRLAGPERRPPALRYDERERLTVAWLELQYWWRHAVRLALDPARLDGRHMTVKLLAEPARVLAWLADGWVAPTRRSALEWLRQARPEHAAAAEVALALEAGRRAPSGALDLVLASLVSMTAAVAADHRGAAGVGLAVRLVGGPLVPAGEAADRALPLADWRARCAPALPDEAFVPWDGDPAIAGELAAAARAGALPRALRRGDVLATTAAGAVPLRGVQSPVTDPVTFALLDDREDATFPAAAGWNARDCALRAVHEHHAWLSRRGGGGGGRSARALGLLLTAARAAALLATLEGGSPRLALTAAAAVAEMERLDPAAGEVAHAALGELHACLREGREPAAELLEAVERAVWALPAYAEVQAASASMPA